MSIAQALAVLPDGTPSPVPLSPSEVGRYLAENYGTDAERCRRERHARRNTLYRDGGCEYMKGVIDRVFKDPVVKELRKEWVEHARFSNSLKRIVNEVSTVYAEPAARKVAGDAANQARLKAFVEVKKCKHLAADTRTCHCVFLLFTLSTRQNRPPQTFRY